jgi:hypothetical protein
LNITYIIWYQRIWSTNSPGWRKMADRGSPTANHMDHVHISFLASPSNGDFSGMGGGGGGGGQVGGALGSTPTASTMGAGAASPNNGFSAAGGYSEAAALGLSGGGYGIAGGVGGGPGAGGGSGGVSSAMGGGGTRGIQGNYGGAGGPGSVRAGTFNSLFTNSIARTAQDFGKIQGMVDVLGWQELDRAKAGPWANYMRKNTDWGHYQARGGDTAVSWNEDKYRALQRGSHDEIDSLSTKGGVRNIPRASAYVLLQDKQTGSKFWVVSSHLQAGAKRGGGYAATQKTQIAQLASLYAKLRKTGIPVISLGDYNNANPGFAKGAERFGRGIDQIYAGGGGISGGGTMGTNSDHPFVWANVNLPGGPGGAKGNGGSVAQNIALGRALAAQRGWTGAQWNALQQLWMRESGWRTNADNPSSSAYGIPQALTSLHGLGDKYKNDPRTQIMWGLNYIAGRYGNPQSAWQFWQKNNYYKSGAWNVPEDQDASIHQGEMVLPAKIADIVRSETAAGTRRSRQSAGIVFQAGSIVVQITGSPSKQAASLAGKQIVDAMMEDSRFKALAEGV